MTDGFMAPSGSDPVRTQETSLARAKIEALRSELQEIEAEFAKTSKHVRFVRARQRLHDKKKKIEAELRALKPYQGHYVPQGTTSAVATILRTLRDGTLWTPEKIEKTRKDLVRIAEDVLSKGGSERYS